MKVAILQEQLVHYRVAFFNKLTDYKEIELTVFCTRDETKDMVRTFQVELIPSFRLGCFVICPGLVHALKDYDTIVVMFDIHWATFVRIAISKKFQRTVFWGIGRSSKSFPLISAMIDRFRVSVAQRADCLVLYSNHIAKYYFSKGFSKDELHVAVNSVESDGDKLDQIEVESDRSWVLFIGTLNARKEVNLLISAYSRLPESLRNSYPLKIVGSGPELTRLREMAVDYGIESSIEFLGAVVDEYELSEILKRSVLSVSPGQAGLSVLKCLSYGVPFVTRKGAISGGEIEHVIDNKTGYLVDGSEESLTDVMLHVLENRGLQAYLQRECWVYFWKYASMDCMVRGMLGAILGIKNDC